jgi:diphthine-ammonia ligase
MCGIIGLFNCKDAQEQIKAALAVLKNRGKDGQDTYEKDGNVLGHTLHAVVSHVPQPIKGKGVLATNCEIYNWQELNSKYNLKAKNDAELLLKFLDKFSIKKIDELDGVYAFAYWYKDELILARDIIGVKPLWYSYNPEEFSFCSEKKVLLKIGKSTVQELNPRQILKYDLKSKNVEVIVRDFFTYLPEHQQSYEKIKDETFNLLSEAIEKRIPNKKFGLLFSGGVDSTFLAHYFKQKGYDFTCYTAVLDTETAIPKDLVYAQKIAKQLDLKLKIKKIKLEELPPYLQKVVPLIEDSNAVKTSVALTLYLACEMAKKDDCKVIFSGLGSEEIFAGYERHKSSANINQECVSGLIKMYERDLYRDDVLTMANSLELRLPFLDKNLIKYCLKIPEKYKFKEGQGKYIFREITFEKGLDKEFAFRKKVAAQYGSRIDNALGRLSKQKGFKTRSAYLKTFYSIPNVKLGVLFSSGKDSTYSAYIMKRQNYELTCLVTIKSKNLDSYMFHTPAVDLAALQAEAMNVPIIIKETEGEKEKELLDLEKALQEAKDKHKIEGVVTGAVFSTYQRDRVERICDKLGLKIFSPLWHKPQEQLMGELLSNNFEIIFTGIAGEGLNKNWLNRAITQKDLDELKEINRKIGTNVAGEGGEFESLVLNCPLFKKKLLIEETEILEDNECTARLLIKKATLVKK